MSTPSEIQAAMSERARGEAREARVERSKWQWVIGDALDWIASHPEHTIEISGDHRPRPVREWMRELSAVERLVSQWSATPDYLGSDYDRGRVDQRHLMTEQLLEALLADDDSGE